ncbi:protein ZNRD2 [Hypomesus transpacificus]|uniref:protein ZNRD2 n=1 Tax=Hypomesus transpacificus TaxID=137520 RepID=UPI001F08288E|nr:protein ZNRD2 [Hypomesus transpacificus]
MALNADDDFEWEPPSEAEMKVIQARRDRQDKISKLMGGYLLKGYKMLGDCCDTCGTILLQDKQQKYYCVSCQELDSDVDKDNPALNAQAALSQVRERQLAAQPGPQVNGGSSQAAVSIVGQPRPEHCEGAASGLRGPLPLPPPATSATSIPSFLPPTTPAAPPVQAAVPLTGPPPLAPQSPALLAVSLAEEALMHKLRWATQELQAAASVESSIQLCSLITSCAQSLRSLRELHQS